MIHILAAHAAAHHAAGYSAGWLLRGLGISAAAGVVMTLLTSLLRRSSS
jgi:hypothetical protein